MASDLKRDSIIDYKNYIHYLQAFVLASSYFTNRTADYFNKVQFSCFGKMIYIFFKHSINWLSDYLYKTPPIGQRYVISQFDR